MAAENECPHNMFKTTTIHVPDSDLDAVCSLLSSQNSNCEHYHRCRHCHGRHSSTNCSIQIKTNILPSIEFQTMDFDLQKRFHNKLCCPVLQRKLYESSKSTSTLTTTPPKILICDRMRIGKFRDSEAFPSNSVIKIFGTLDMVNFEPGNLAQLQRHIIFCPKNVELENSVLVPDEFQIISSSQVENLIIDSSTSSFPLEQLLNNFQNLQVLRILIKPAPPENWEQILANWPNSLNLVKVYISILLPEMVIKNPSALAQFIRRQKHGFILELDGTGRGRLPNLAEISQYFRPATEEADEKQLIIHYRNPDSPHARNLGRIIHCHFITKFTPILEV